MADLGEGSVNLAHLGSNCLAHGKVLYKRTRRGGRGGQNSPHRGRSGQADQGRVRTAAGRDLGARRDADRAPLLHDNVFTN